MRNNVIKEEEQSETGQVKDDYSLADEERENQLMRIEMLPDKDKASVAQTSRIPDNSML